jgi:hypothetical protein
MEKILNSTPGRGPSGVPRHPSVRISFLVQYFVFMLFAAVKTRLSSEEGGGKTGGSTGEDDVSTDTSSNHVTDQSDWSKTKHILKKIKKSLVCSNHLGRASGPSNYFMIAVTTTVRSL